MFHLHDQVAVPIDVAKVMTYPEKVTKTNIDLMRQLVRNGCDSHPGADMIQNGETGFKKWVLCVQGTKKGLSTKTFLSNSPFTVIYIY